MRGSAFLEPETETPVLIGTQDDDWVLMVRHREGDPRAFEELYRRHNGALYRSFFRHTRLEMKEIVAAYPDIELRGPFHFLPGLADADLAARC